MNCFLIYSADVTSAPKEVISVHPGPRFMRFDGQLSAKELWPCSLSRLSDSMYFDACILTVCL